jgi:hypothetical protein
MDLPVIEMEREAAQEAFRTYQAAVREPRRKELNAVRRRVEAEDRAMMRGYRELAAGRQVIELSKAIAAGGTEDLECETQGYRKGEWRTFTVTLRVPKIAVVRADAQRVFTRGVDRDGGVLFRADSENAAKKVDRVSINDGVFDRYQNSWGVYARATTPSIPPPFRPPHNLAGYHLLFEAEWNAFAPIDPALLKHLGGDLYAVLAVWDLTDLERAVLNGRS